MCGDLSRTTDLFQIKLSLLANQIGRIKFVRLSISHFDRLSIFFSPKTIRYELRDSRKIQGFALIYEQSCFLFMHVSAI